jgi:hypothetical protein
MTQLDLSNRIVRTETSNSSVTCEWEDGHKSIFEEEWLLARRFTQDNVTSRRKGFRDTPKLVGSDYSIERESFHVE